MLETRGGAVRRAASRPPHRRNSVPIQRCTLALCGSAPETAFRSTTFLIFGFRACLFGWGTGCTQGVSVVTPVNVMINAPISTADGWCLSTNTYCYEIHGCTFTQNPRVTNNRATDIYVHDGSVLFGPIEPGHARCSAGCAHVEPAEVLDLGRSTSGGCVARPHGCLVMEACVAAPPRGGLLRVPEPRPIHPQKGVRPPADLGATAACGPCLPPFGRVLKSSRVPSHRAASASWNTTAYEHMTAFGPCLPRFPDQTAASMSSHYPPLVRPHSPGRHWNRVDGSADGQPLGGSALRTSGPGHPTKKGPVGSRDARERNANHDATSKGRQDRDRFRLPDA